MILGLYNFEHFLILASLITGCVSICAFASLIGILIEIKNSAIGLKIYAITAGIEKEIIKRKKKKYDKIVSSAKSKLNSIEVLISKDLNDSVISQHEFVTKNHVLKQYSKMKEGLNSSSKNLLYL